MVHDVDGRTIVEVEYKLLVDVQTLTSIANLLSHAPQLTTTICFFCFFFLVERIIP